MHPISEVFAREYTANMNETDETFDVVDVLRRVTACANRDTTTQQEER